MKTDELQHVHTQLIWWPSFNLNQLTDEYWPAVVSVIAALHPTYLLSVDIWILLRGGFFYFVLPHVMISVMDFFSFLSPLFFFLFRCCVCRYPPFLHLCAGCKTAVELRWEVRELQRHQGEQAICVCVCFCWCVVLLSGLPLCNLKLACSHILAHHVVSDVSFLWQTTVQPELCR